MNKISCDSQAIFRAGTPKCWPWTKICASLLNARIWTDAHAITTFPWVDRIVAALLRPDLTRLRNCWRPPAAGDVIAGEFGFANTYLQQGFRACLSQRDGTGAGGVRPPRGSGRDLLPPQLMLPDSPKRIWWARASATGSRPRRCASGLIVQGCKNRESPPAEDDRTMIRITFARFTTRRGQRSPGTALFTIHHRCWRRPPPRWAAGLRPKNAPVGSA